MRCINCEFYNQSAAHYCLDCGTTDFTNPTLFGEGKEAAEPEISLKFVFVSTAIILLIVVFITLTQDPNNLYTNLFYAVPSVFFANFLISMTVMFSKQFTIHREEKRREKASDGNISLNSISEEVNYKVNLLTYENKELIDLFAFVYEDDEEINKIEYVETSETDKRLFETIEIQLALCQMQFDEIELIRLKGELLYYREVLQGSETKPAVDEETIEELLEEFELLGESYQFNEDNQYKDLLLEKEKVFCKKVESARESGEKLREKLIEKQNLSFGETNFLTPQTEYSPNDRNFADFNIRHISDDYSQTFNKLESEYARLKSLKTSGAIN